MKDVVLRAVVPIISDLRRSGVRILAGEDETAVGVTVRVDQTFAEQVVAAAATVQRWATDRLRDGPLSVWPDCPLHRNAHELYGPSSPGRCLPVRSSPSAAPLPPVSRVSGVAWPVVVVIAPLAAPGQHPLPTQAVAFADWMTN